VAVKTYQSASTNFQITATQETKKGDSTGHSGRAQMIPGKVIQFIGGMYSTADATEQTFLDARVSDPRSGIS
jgi:hypothetical protein